MLRDVAGDEGVPGVDLSLSILVLHGIRNAAAERQTSIRHLFAMQRYSAKHNFLYHFIDDPVTETLLSMKFDIVFLDATFLCWRWVRPKEVFDAVKDKYMFLKETGATIVALPQDDYDHAAVLDKWLTDVGTSILVSVYWENHSTLYPRLMASGVSILNGLTGYIDDADIEAYERCQLPFESRPIDVSYRVRRLPAWFGRFGILKSEFGRAFKGAASSSGFVLDISDAPGDVLLGDSWRNFLGSSKFALACEGGSSVLDPRGFIRERVEEYCSEHPNASYDEIAENCFEAQTEAFTFSVISPRVLEAALAGCCPVMIEGRYNGYVSPDEHYIPVRKDFANLNDVIERMRDTHSSSRIARRFSEVILDNPSLRYSGWIKLLFEKILEVRGDQSSCSSLHEAEFSLLREQHISTLICTYASQLAEQSERNRILGNSVMHAREAATTAISELQLLLEKLNH